MVGIILASHGDSARDVLQFGEMIFGTQPNAKAVTLQSNEGSDGTRARMEEAITTFESPKQVLFMVGLWGDTPFSQISGLINDHKDTRAVVTGLSLLILIEAFASRMSMESAQETTAHVYEVVKEGVRPPLEVLEPAQEKQATESMTSQGAIPKGTVVGNGHVKHVLTRIDSRLLHGQVVTAWAKTIRPACIIMVPDSVTKGELRKGLIEQATPPSVKTNVVPIDKTIQVAKGPRSGSTKMVLLPGTSQDTLRTTENGVNMKGPDINSTAHSIGKIVVGKALSFGKDDVKTFERLRAERIQSGMYKVPNDSRGNMDGIIKKTRIELT